MAIRSGYVAQKPMSRGIPSQAPRRYTLDPVSVVREGRRREFLTLLAISLGLGAVQIPMYLVALGHWDQPAGLRGMAQSARLLTSVDLLFIVSYLYLARRALEMARAHRVSQPWRSVARVGIWLVVLGAAMDVTENVRLWVTYSAKHPSLNLSLRDAVGWHVLPDGYGLWSWLMRAMVLLGLVTLLTAVLVPVTDAPPAEAGPANLRNPSGLVICCSGGGIRAAAFSLGGLQALDEHGLYRRASAVVGVSGGGYMATAHHILRWSPSGRDGAANAAEPEWPVLAKDEPAFGLGSPETHWIRRHTRYVLNSLRVATEAVLSLLFGIAVNLLLIAAAMGGTAVFLAWLYLASGRLVPWPDLSTFAATERPHVVDSGMNGSYSGDWAFLGWTWVIPAVGVGLFILIKGLDRWYTLSLSRERFLNAIVMNVLWVGLGLTVMVQGVPALVAALSHYAADNGSPLAGLLFHLGFVPTDVCKDIVTFQSGCGTELKSPVNPTSAAVVRTASIVTIVGSILAVLASAKSASTSVTTEVDSFLGKAAKRLWAKVKDPIVPWTALVVILVVGALVFLVWVTRAVQSFDELHLLRIAAVVGGLLVLAKVGTEPNRTSMHSFFRERISEAFLVRRTSKGIVPLDYRQPVRFSRSAPRDGGPQLVTCAVANVSDEELVPSKRGCTPFVFDQNRIGLTDQLLPEVAARRASATYEFGADERYRVATIPAATAISAAAFSPLAGRENIRLGPYRAVLALGNARLGVWLPNPLWVDEAFLVPRLLRRRQYAEAQRVWSRLSPGDRTYLQLDSRDHQLLKKGELLNDLSGVLNKLEMAFRGTDQTAQTAASEQAVAMLTKAQPTTGIPVPEPLPSPSKASSAVSSRPQVNAQLDLRPALHKAITVLTPHVPLPSRLWQDLRDIFQKPGLTRVVKEAVGKASVFDRFLYVTDGGHYDNLGLVEALRRRPGHIIVLDASNDPEDTFRTLGRAIATARMDLDCEVHLDPRNMKTVTDPAGRATAAWCRGTFKFAGDGFCGDILHIKAIMLDELSWDIDTYAGDAPDFPRTSTTNQLYSEFDFEAYRALGTEAVERALASQAYKLASQVYNADPS